MKTNMKNLNLKKGGEKVMKKANNGKKHQQKQRGVYKYGDYYYICYSHNGRLVRKSTRQKSFRVAQEMLQTVKADIIRGVYNMDKVPAPLFEEYADYWLEYYSKPNKRSWARDVTSINFLKRALSGMRLDEINREHINRYKVDRRKQKSRFGKQPAVATINRELACLNTIFTMAIQEGKVATSPAAGRGVKFKENNKQERILSYPEEARLYEECIAHLSPYVYWIVFTALQTGMRKGELLTLKWENVDFANRTITVVAEIAKNGKARKVPMNKGLTTLLKHVKKVTAKHGEFVFSGRKAFTRIYKSFQRAKELTGIDPDFRFHDLRHTVASRLVTECGVDLVTVAKILGHTELKTLERYVHTRKNIEMNAVELLGENGIEPQVHNKCIIAKKIKNSDKTDNLISLVDSDLPNAPVAQHG